MTVPRSLGSSCPSAIRASTRAAGASDDLGHPGDQPESESAAPLDTEPFARLSAYKTHAALVVVALCAYVSVLALHGFLPGMSQPTVQAHLASGAIDCLRLDGVGALTGWCDRIGLPIGQPLLTGLPQTYAGLVISYLPYVTSLHAHIIVDALCDAFGFAGVYLLARRWGAHPLAGIAAAFAYLSSLSVLFINGFAATFNGVILMPFHIWLALAILDMIAAQAPWRRWAPLLAANTFVLVFTDGYTFMETSLVIGALVLAWTLDNGMTRRVRLIGAAHFAAMNLVFVGLYLLYVPGGAYDAGVTIDTFRSMGADVSTFVLPQHHLWWSEFTGLSVDFRMGWGDYGASRSNYLGLIPLLLASAAVWNFRRNRHIVAFAMAAAAACLLSLGPSLKVYDLYVRDLAQEPNAYVMPPTEATLGLPTTLLYEFVPGFNAMRATFRWIVVTVLCVTVLAAVTTSAWWKGRRRALAIVVGLLALIEIAPDYQQFIAVNEAKGQQVDAFRNGPLAQFPNLVRPGERLLLLPAGNDFLANTLVPISGARSYNIGIDKNMWLSRSKWPSDVIRAAETYGTPEGKDAIVTALSTDVDAVVFPFFSMQRNAQVWPPTPPERDHYAEVASRYFDDTRFDIVVTEWFAVIRLGTT